MTFTEDSQSKRISKKRASYESIFRKFGIEIISPIQLALEAFLQA